MTAGYWSIRLGTDLCGKTVGLSGLGLIARKVVRRLTGFGVRLLVTTRTRDEAFAAANGIRFVDRDTLLRESDYVSLHAPLTEDTAAMIDERALSLRSEEHTSELQSLMRISYAVFCLKKQKNTT